MSKTLKHIQSPVEKELKEFERKFRESMKSNVPLLDKITHYIVQSKGKQIRPLLVLLSASICGKINESTYTAASLVEMIHTASLVHDDVVDESNERRGFFSVNALWKNKIAVLVGDFLFSKGLLMSMENEEFELLRIMSSCAKKISEGELMQMQKTRKLNITEDVYYEIIASKTAALLASACRAGAASTTEDREYHERLEQLGLDLGMAYQIRDDLLDFSHDNIGKPTGIDIQEKKITLPLIVALRNGSAKERRHIKSLIRNHSKDQKSVDEVIEFVNKSQGVSYAQEKMREYRNAAIKTLEELPDSLYRDSFRDLIEYVIDRKK